jgi:hypothetical protein
MEEPQEEDATLSKWKHPPVKELCVEALEQDLNLKSPSQKS